MLLLKNKTKHVDIYSKQGNTEISTLQNNLHHLIRIQNNMSANNSTET